MAPAPEDGVWRPTAPATPGHLGVKAYRPSPTPGHVDVKAYRPSHSGFRFSRKAVTPSAKSRLP